MRRGVVAAWGLVAFSVVMLVIDTIVVSETQSLVSEDALTRHGWPVVNLASLGAVTIGAIIVTGKGRNPVGWLLTFVGATTSLSLVAESYAYWAFETGDPYAHPFSRFAAYVSTVTGGVLALTCLTWVFLIVPDGRFLSSRWRLMAFGSAAAYLLFTAGQLSVDPFLLIDGSDDFVQVPVVAQWMVNIGFVSVGLCVLASVVAMALRLRRSAGEMRQQLRWIASGAAAIGFGVLCVAIGQILNGGESTWYTNMPLYLAYFYLLVTIAIAILRYRLYDIDVIISRALVFAGATAFVVAAYVVVVIAVGGALDNWTEGFWLSLVVTVAVAVAFQPIRYHLLRLANRLTYGKQAAPYDALADFSRRLGVGPDPVVLLPAIAEAAGRATLATMAVVRLGPTERPTRVVTWPNESEAWAAAAGPIVEVPVADKLGPLGAISVAPPPGMTLRPRELRLLRDIADQAAVAFRNVGLEVELAAHVVLLDEQTDKLAASRRRLISAGDAERRRLESAISREVLPTLTDLRTTLGRIGSADSQDVATSDLVDDATRALEALRELTRGVYPTLLTRAGLAPALTSYFSRLGRSEDLVIEQDLAARRFAERVEVAAYYCCTQVVADVSGPSQVRLSTDEDGLLRIELIVTETALLDVEALTDRVEACGGSLEIDDQTWLTSDAALVVRLPTRLDQGSTVADSHA